MKYRSELDGLRAIAIIPVLFFHAGYDWASGGFIGVDIFFVISGYLIAQIIFSKIEIDNNFHLTDFLIRRFWRLAPALYTVSLCTVIPAYFILLPQEFKDFAGSLWSSTLFASNVWFFDKIDYFRPVSKDAFLLHTWSLGAEMQFYIFLALLIPIAVKLKRLSPTNILVLVTVLSFLAALFAWPNKPEANFFLPVSRVWEFTFGALLAISPGSLNFKRVWNELLSIFGVLLIVAALFLINKGTYHPGFATLLPISGAALLIKFATSGTLSHRIMTLGPFVFLGVISYSLYLWHQPLLAISRMLNPGPLSDFQVAAIFVVSIILALVTLKFIEKPMRQRQVQKSRVTHVFATLTVALIVVFGVAIETKDGLPSRLSAQVLELLNDKSAENTNLRCMMSRVNGWTDERLCVHNDGLSRQFVILGDSHANALVEELAERLKIYDISLVEFTMGGCAPNIWLAQFARGSACKEFVTEYWKKVVELKPEAIIFAARWNVYPVRNSREAKKMNRPESLYFNGFVENFRDIATDLLEKNISVFAVSTVPTQDKHVRYEAVRKLHLGSDTFKSISINVDQHKEVDYIALTAFATLQDEGILEFLNPSLALCNLVKSGDCLGSGPINRGDSHFS